MQQRSVEKRVARSGRATRIDRTTRLAVISLLMLLVLAVRLHYYSGPIFANTQDEGIYLDSYASAIIFHNPVTFAQYRNANLSNISGCLCNPADIFQFYVGFSYPEMLLLALSGFSAAVAIYYVIFTSLIEGLFIFLVLEKVSGTRAGAIGLALFAFLPADVLFATHVQPLVPAMMFVTIGAYAFVVAFERKRPEYYAAAGFFSGLAYITNPVGALLAIFIAAALTVRMLLGMVNLRRYAFMLALFAAGFLAAYAIIGTVFLAESGNFLLYPSVTHAVYLYEEATQPISAHCMSNICLDYVTGYPQYYLRILAGLPTGIDTYIKYYGIGFYIFVAAAAFMFFTRRNRWGVMFVAMFGFYLACIMLFPANIHFGNGTLTYYPIDEQPYVATILTLPLITVTALALDRLAGSGKRLIVVAAAVLLIAIIASDIIVLNSDIVYYRDSVYTLHAFVGYVESHPGVYYANSLFASEANLLSGYRYNIESLGNCTESYISRLPDNASIVIGGTVSLDISPQYTQGFDKCVSGNMTGYSVEDRIENPLGSVSGMYGPELDVYGKS